MKILKLKSILFNLMAIAMVTVLLTSCEQDTIENAELDKTEHRAIEMVDDFDYQEFNRLQSDLINQIFEVLDRNDIATYDLNSIYLEDEGKRLNELFSDESIIDIQQELTKTAEKLTTKYGDILIADNELETNQSIEDAFLNLTYIENEDLVTLRDCSWRYTLCSVAATTAYMAAAGAAGSVTGGAGAAFVLVAASTTYAYALTECHRKHCK